MTFVKLDCGILDSSLWHESATVVKVFITMLAMCRADGIVEATAPGIARRACLPVSTVRNALEKLEAPDPDDKSGINEGRRVKRVSGGYEVVNYLSYRNKDHTAAERQRRHRAASRVTSRHVTQAYVEAEGEAEEETENKRLLDPAQERPTNGNGPLTDEQRQEYAEAVWKAFLAKSGLPETRVSSPGDFVTLKGWMDAGIPLRIVLRAFKDTKGKGRCLAYFAPSVRDAFDYYRKASA